jgi:plasmid maintenance system antidote protein VapI
MTPNNQLPAIHVGEFLAEILEDISMKPSNFSRSIGVSVIEITVISKGTSPIID